MYKIALKMHFSINVCLGEGKRISPFSAWQPTKNVTRMMMGRGNFYQVSQCDAHGCHGDCQQLSWQPPSAFRIRVGPGGALIICVIYNNVDSIAAASIGFIFSHSFFQGFFSPITL